VKIFPLLGLGVATLAFVSLAASITTAPTTAVLGLTSVVGIGLGMVMPPTQVSVQLAAGHESLGAATASISLSRSIGGAVGVALTGAVLFAALGDTSLGVLLQDVVKGGAASIERLSADQRAAFAAQLDAAYRIAFAVLALITAVGVVLAGTIPKPDWDRHA
jgi:hypothetical protein